MQHTRHIRGQAAMEFLITYGWAFLVVLAVIAALAYFGILTPAKYLPEKCIMESGFVCSGVRIEEGSSTIVLLNSKGKQVQITNVAIGTCSSAFAVTMEDGLQETFALSGCDNGAQKEVFSDEVTVTYTESESNLEKTAFGEITTKVE